MIEELWTGLLELSGQYIVPDWGALVALIPLALAGLVFLYLTWTVYRFATAGPTSRGIRRLPPVTPEGIHMPGPSFAPVLAAFGAFMLLFGMFSGGIWLWIGVVVLVITLLYWGREAIRDYDHAVHPAATAAGELQSGEVQPGALPVPSDGTPPPGVHVPPPSFRPLLVSIGFTMLVGGMIVGGWALLFGIIAMALVLLGWLRDSRKEYSAVAEADRTGHLDLGGAPSWPKATFAALGVLLAAGIILTSGVLTGSGDGTAAPSGGPVASGEAGGGTGGGATPGPSLPAADGALTAENVAYLETSITVPAGKPFTLALDNRDPVPHNVEIKDGGGASPFKGEIFSGPAVKVYDVPALAAGQYTFVCTVHPNMTGTVTAQ
ncbi:MAG: cupredoxin domain-containing protein [Chloroflexi bacterium]|nr:cupredoxin domain-containing protein [Chloroflexota bacterium]